MKRRMLLIIGAMPLVAVACGGLGETAGGDVHPGTAEPGATAIVMRDDTFEPASVDVPQGAVQFELRNEGANNHNFTNEALKVSTGPVKPGEVVTVNVTIPAGANQFLCTWHPGMAISVTGS